MPRLDPAFCGLLPHPPIIVPDVGRNRLQQCQQTVEACREFSRRLVAAEPERVFLVSPHAPRKPGAFGLWTGESLAGDLGRFGAPQAGVDLANDGPTLAELANEASTHGIQTWSIPPTTALDHGAVVPLWYLVEAGFSGPTAVCSLPWEPTQEQLASFGKAVGKILAKATGRSALVASGDMTHRAKEGAPSGYHPRAVEFDQELCRLVAAGRLAEISNIDGELRQLAAEDAADSCGLVASALDFEARGAEVLSYEHPFGVGYLVAVFDEGK